MDKTELKMKTFNTAIEMANWISINVKDKFEQEKLMMEGYDNKKSHGSYSIKEDNWITVIEIYTKASLLEGKVKTAYSNNISFRRSIELWGDSTDYILNTIEYGMIPLQEYLELTTTYLFKDVGRGTYQKF